MTIFQACRGKYSDRGTRVSYTEVDSVPFSRVPIYADFLFVYSCYPGYVSFSNETKGSWFIQTLCEVLDEHAATRELMANLTLVNR